MWVFSPMCLSLDFPQSPKRHLSSQIHGEGWMRKYVENAQNSTCPNKCSANDSGCMIILCQNSWVSCPSLWQHLSIGRWLLSVPFGARCEGYRVICLWKFSCPWFLSYREQTTCLFTSQALRWKRHTWEWYTSSARPVAPGWDDEPWTQNRCCKGVNHAGTWQLLFLHVRGMWRILVRRWSIVECFPKWLCWYFTSHEPFTMWLCHFYPQEIVCFFSPWIWAGFVACLDK